MKKSFFIYLCGLLAFVTFYACNPNDKDLQKNVESVLIAYPGVSASVNKGIATLSGTVASEDIKEGAERATKAIQHIKSVNNNIVVNAPVISTPVVSSDDVLTQTIRTSMDNDGFKDVKIDIENGEVTLTGKVKRTDLQKVMQIANDASPKRVINKLELE